ncbi:hypothetical protein GOBAR_DD11865 [Gossypium barbadense]|nr:hypothetical protein GOBAR_DD11865 [Gossypium barbadense]
MKVDLSDPTVPSGKAVAHQIKVTLGITGCLPIKAARDLGLERHETVQPISGVGVRALIGPFLVREDREGRTSSVPVIVPTINVG